MIRVAISLISLMLLSGCFGWWPGSKPDPSPTITMIDEAIEEAMKEDEESDSDMEESEPEPKTDPEMVEETEEEADPMDEPVRRPDPEEVEEEAEEEVTPMPAPPPPPPPMMTDFDYWEDAQAEFLNVRTTFPATITVDGRTLTADTMPPSGPATWEGPITGEMNPTRDYLSDPRIMLSYDFRASSIGAEISYMSDGSRSTFERYGASVKSDGTFSSFDGLNPKGFDGGFYGNEAYVAGSVSTPRVHGTYVAQ